MNTIDLHTHTTFSDGTLTPTELIQKAAAVGLRAIAVTDHDTTAGLEEAETAAKAFPALELICGTELSSLYKGKEIHIVGLFINKDDNSFKIALSDLREKRIKRNKKMINKLKSIGLDVTYEELLSQSGGNVVTRAHFAGLLQNKGYVQSKNEAFDKYIGAGKAGYVKREVLSSKAAIELINSAQAAAVIAHPFAYGFNSFELEEMIADFACWGAAAMECYYPTHSVEDTIYALNLCKTYNLLPSGGSDFHGENKPGLELGSGYGDLYVPQSVLENLKKFQEDLLCQKNP